VNLVSDGCRDVCRHPPVPARVGQGHTHPARKGRDHVTDRRPPRKRFQASVFVRRRQARATLALVGRHRTKPTAARRRRARTSSSISVGKVVLVCSARHAGPAVARDPDGWAVARPASNRRTAGGRCRWRPARLAGSSPAAYPQGGGVRERRSGVGCSCAECGETRTARLNQSAHLLLLLDRSCSQ
jgi:hypothetical protein